MVTIGRPQSRTVRGKPGFRVLFGALLVMHGIAHLVGTTAAFSAVDDGGTVEYLAGEWVISDNTQLTILGVMWASLAAGFAAAALATWTNRASSTRLIGIVASVSLVMCIIALWETAIGVVVNAALLIAIARTTQLKQVTS